MSDSSHEHQVRHAVSQPVLRICGTEPNEEIYCPDTSLVNRSNNALVLEGCTGLTNCATGVQHARTPVTLHVYDLHRTTKFIGLQVFHTAVEVHGLEYFFSARGISSCTPAGHMWHSYKLPVELGHTGLGVDEVSSLLHRMAATWQGADYRLLENNCHNFAIAFCEKLGVQGRCKYTDPEKFRSRNFFAGKGVALLQCIGIASKSMPC